MPCIPLLYDNGKDTFFCTVDRQPSHHKPVEEWERAATCAAEWHMLSAAKAQVVVGGGAAEQGGCRWGSSDTADELHRLWATTLRLGGGADAKTSV